MALSLAQDIKALLHQQGRLRVWSIIVTIMGDVVETMGGEITIAELIEICTKLDIEPQAVRTAMSRLSKEGWVERIPNGRSTQYRFSAKRRGEFIDAAEYIYASPRDDKLNWVFGLLPPVSLAQKQVIIDNMDAALPIVMNNQIIVWREDYNHKIENSELAVLTIFKSKPDRWDEDILNHLSPSPQADIIAKLLDILDTLSDKTVDADSALIIRILAIHFWRRFVLRYPLVQSPFDEDIWPLPRLRHRIAQVYKSLVLTSEAALPRSMNSKVLSSRFVS